MKLQGEISVYMFPSEHRDALHPKPNSPHTEVQCKVEEQPANLLSPLETNSASEMSHHMNPFTQGGWSTGNGHSASYAWNTDDTPPSVFGALPSVSDEFDNVTYQFTGFNSTILNCSVVGPQGQVAYRVVTESTAPSCTIVKDTVNRNIAMVQWQPHSTLEIYRITPQQRIKDWLRVSTDSSGPKRIMEVGGVKYAWIVLDKYICLQKVQSAAPRVLARIARGRNAALLELTQEALRSGLLHSCIVATIMLLCGINID